MPFVPRNSTLVTIFAGGNDANTIGEAVRAARAAPIRGASSPRRSTNFGRDLDARHGIRGRAANARIVVLNLPNLAGLPYARGTHLDEKRALQHDRRGILRADQHADAAGRAGDRPDVRRAIVRRRELLERRLPPERRRLLVPHGLVYAAATTGSVPPPRASCPQMTLF